jgi:hypothetical protein
VRGIDLFVRSDADQLADLAARVSTGELRVEIAQRVPLAELSTVHAQAAAGALPGKTVIVVPTASSEPARRNVEVGRPSGPFVCRDQTP